MRACLSPRCRCSWAIEQHPYYARRMPLYDRAMFNIGLRAAPTPHAGLVNLTDKHALRSRVITGIARTLPQDFASPGPNVIKLCEVLRSYACTRRHLAPSAFVFLDCGSHLLCALLLASKAVRSSFSPIRLKSTVNERQQGHAKPTSIQKMLFPSKKPKKA